MGIHVEVFNVKCKGFSTEDAIMLPQNIMYNKIVSDK